MLLFNRPDLVTQALTALRPARPPRVYLAADGPRAGRDEDVAACAMARRQAMAAIDWPCQVKTLFRENNLGCARAVHGAVSWFFEHEPEGIILEDDCVAAPSFFRFCTELLERYRDDPRVFAISGDNFVESATPRQPSYWFNGVFHVWGWASWRDRWTAVPLTIEAADEAAIARALRNAGQSAAEIAYWTPLFMRVRSNADPAQRIDSWAYPAAYHVFVHRYLSISPARNLVGNVGFGPGSTHFTDGPVRAGMQVSVGDLTFPLTHPRRVALHQTLHRLNLLQHFGVRTDRIGGVFADAIRRLGRRRQKP